VPATALREGGPAPREVPFPEGQALLDLAMGGGRLALLLTSLEGVFVGQLAAPGGALETAGRFDVGGIFATVASPSGHHLLWTVVGDAGKRLVGATLVPGGGVREFVRMELPRSCVGGVMTGTGEQFVTIDTDRDLVLAVE
jgi:hypothetical protein